MHSNISFQDEFSLLVELIQLIYFDDLKFLNIRRENL